jgi:hypothetical protein
MKYVGVKIIDAVPRKGGINDRLGNHAIGEDGYAVTYPDGFKSWCPKVEFEKANR